MSFIPGLPAGHTVMITSSNPNQINGNVYKAICINTKVKTKQHLVIMRMRLNGTHEHVRTFFGGGGPGAYSEWQIAPGDCSMRPDGTLVVDFSVMVPGSEEPIFRPVTELIPGCDVAWSFQGSAIQVPLPPVIVGNVDQIARDSAAVAREQAKLANAQSSQNASEIGTLKKVDEALQSQDRALQAQIDALPTVAEVSEIAWSKAGDYTGTPEFLAKVKAIALQVFVEAINYARTASAANSRLRALIELIIGENKTTA